VGIQSFDKLRIHGEPVEPWIPAGVYPHGNGGGNDINYPSPFPLPQGEREK